MFDPTSQDLYILTKNHTGSEASIYKFTPTNEPSQDVISMESIGRDDEGECGHDSLRF